MRITNQMMTDHAIRYTSANLEAYSAIQDKLDTGKKFQNASDDPAAASLSLKVRSSLTTLQSYQDTAANASDWLSASDFSFGQMEDLVTKAVGLVQSGLNDTLGAEERKNSLGTEMDNIIKEALEIANNTQNDQYIFSGTLINTKPFDYDVDGNLVYNGNTATMTRSLGPGHSVAVNTTGDNAFLPVLQTLINARDALNNNQLDDLRDSLGDLNTGLDTVSMYRGANGAKMRQVDNTSDYLDNSETEMKSLLSQYEDINTAEAISMMSSQQTTYQAVLEVSQRAISALSLFDYLN